MEANLGLIHLQQLFEELALGQNSLRVTRNAVQMAKVFAIHGSKYEIAILLAVGQETQGRKKLGEAFVRDHAARREHAHDLVI